MRKLFLSALMITLAVLISGSWEKQLRAQQQLSNPDDYMKGEDFTRILKDEWGYLRDATDGYLGSIDKKSEFETSKEYGDRIAKAKAAFVAKINAHIQEKKFDKRVFGVLFKASLVSYNADLQQYIISSSESIEAPYDIPTLHCIVPRNSFVALTDSVNRGFRTSALRIKFPSNYRWSVARDEAKIAKGEEPNIFFQIRFVLDLRQEDMVKQARLRIMPTQISMLNPTSHKIYWSTEIK